MQAPRLSVVIVTWRSATDVGESMAALESELLADDELIVIDNASDDGTPDLVAEHSQRARLVRNPDNRGFVVAVNQGARLASNELLVLLNPDATVEAGWRAGIVRPWRENYGWGAWQPLITSEGGRVINSAGNSIHFTGVCWAGGAGRPVDEAPRGPREIGYASGACLAVPLELWRQVGGFPERLFMYGDDVDVCLRLRLAGYRIGIEPSARVEHHYEFNKGPAKWRYLERSRWAFVIRTYPRPLLWRLFPALIATEAAIVSAAITGGWLGPKLWAMRDLLRWMPELRVERQQIQASKRITAAEFAAAMTADLDSAYLGRVGRSRMLRRGLRWYWRKVLKGLRSPAKSDGSGSR